MRSLYADLRCVDVAALHGCVHADAARSGSHARPGLASTASAEDNNQKKGRSDPGLGTGWQTAASGVVRRRTSPNSACLASSFRILTGSTQEQPFARNILALPDRAAQSAASMPAAEHSQLCTPPFHSSVRGQASHAAHSGNTSQHVQGGDAGHPRVQGTAGSCQALHACIDRRPQHGQSQKSVATRGRTALRVCSTGRPGRLSRRSSEGEATQKYRNTIRSIGIPRMGDEMKFWDRWHADDADGARR